MIKKGFFFLVIACLLLQPAIGSDTTQHQLKFEDYLIEYVKYQVNFDLSTQSLHIKTFIEENNIPLESVAFSLMNVLNYYYLNYPDNSGLLHTVETRVFHELRNYQYRGLKQHLRYSIIIRNNLEPESLSSNVFRFYIDLYGFDEWLLNSLTTTVYDHSNSVFIVARMIKAINNNNAIDFKDNPLYSIAVDYTLKVESPKTFVVLDNFLTENFSSYEVRFLTERRKQAEDLIKRANELDDYIFQYLTDLNGGKPNGSGQ